MLKIEDLYKEKDNNVIKNINIDLQAGNSISLECCNEVSDLLLDIILGKEIPAKGKVYLEDKLNITYFKKSISEIGVILREDSFYERMSIKSYMKLFEEILGTKINYKEILLKVALLDIEDTEIKKLNYSQRRRLSLARERLKEPKLLIFQEPILNMDREGAKIIIENIEEMRSNGTAVLTTSLLFKDTLMLGDKAYRLNEEGLIEIENNSDENDRGEEIDKRPVYKIEKIPAKVDERILLFDPTEIDYVESDQGISTLNIRGDKFPCSLSLTELEDRLKYFGFFRCHRSYLVNLQRVREVITWTRNSYSLNLDDKIKSSIPLSKGRLEELKAILKL
ncbi:LytTR family transcriptional regulator DNA-binding domain-containing protein [Clostridium paridis]|uniref:LytTR family transcriptional regulator DNA-binding domain-containing protein n=1 Tax=Clostridium paridis TaxID=2803863 RepID=A0A937K4C3_9CLOT|nr:LytTR family transcriptional regulator DNA-binding domain-containing protein [Clostridium paridis]MBL4931724.1 LytTR family transcriptional regulator DNA-binding domain-containing protein [Clostridium paridis]